MSTATLEERVGLFALRHLLQLCAGDLGTVVRRQPLVAAANQLGDISPDLGPLGHVVLQVRSPQWPEPRVVRLYRWSHMLVAIRHMHVKALVARSSVRVPATLATGPVGLGQQSVLAVIEQLEPGLHPVRWSPKEARRLGQDLARWHKTRTSPRDASTMIISVQGVGAYHWRTITRAARLRAAHRSPALLKELARGLRALTNKDLRGPVALSHGDLSNHNLLVNSRGELIWLDLDGACRRPCRHDLALAEILLLHQAPEAIRAFEEQYFEAHPADWEAWHRHRLGWFRVASSLYALQMLTPRREPAQLGPWQRRWLAISSACWEVEDIGQTSGALVGEILQLAGRNVDVQE